MPDQRHSEVTVLEKAETAAAGEMLGRAFSTDSLWAAVLSDPEPRHEKLVGMFTGLIKTTIAASGVAEKTPGLTGAAVWLSPGRQTGTLAMVKSGFALPRFAMRLPKGDRNRLMSVLREGEEFRKALMPEPHWYLSAIGVDTESQGRGVGSALMEHGLARADRYNQPIYLETGTESNVAFYRHLGFEVVEEFTPSGLDAHVWLMSRGNQSHISRP